MAIAGDTCLWTNYQRSWQEGATASNIGLPAGSNPHPGYGTMLTSDVAGLPLSLHQALMPLHPPALLLNIMILALPIMLALPARLCLSIIKEDILCL